MTKSLKKDETLENLTWNLAAAILRSCGLFMAWREGTATPENVDDAEDLLKSYFFQMIYLRSEILTTMLPINWQSG
jgi:hypothetical protein